MIQPLTLLQTTTVSLALLLGSLSNQALHAEPAPKKNPQINFEAFLQVASEAGAYREDRKVSLENFQKMAQEPNTIILDTRSKAKYDKKHLEGAVHLNFSEITKEELERVVPTKDTRILIYCNNNFKKNSPAFPVKSGATALNIPTFITLYEYGYRNLYELDALIDEDNPRLRFESND